MAKKTEGKRFEEDIAASVPKEWFCYRLKDSSGSWSNDKSISRFTPKNMCDFFIHTATLSPMLYGIECKSFKGKSMSYNLLNDKDDKKLDDLSDMGFKTRCEGGFILNFRDLNETYYIEANTLREIKQEGTRKSLSLKQVKENGFIIPQKLKKIRYKYYLESVL